MPGRYIILLVDSYKMGTECWWSFDERHPQLMSLGLVTLVDVNPSHLKGKFSTNNSNTVPWGENDKHRPRGF